MNSDWLAKIPTDSLGLTCRFEDVRRVFQEHAEDLTRENIDLHERLDYSLKQEHGLRKEVEARTHCIRCGADQRSGQRPRTLSEFIRNASPEEKAEVYTEVMQKATERQNSAHAAYLIFEDCIARGQSTREAFMRAIPRLVQPRGDSGNS